MAALVATVQETREQNGANSYRRHYLAAAATASTELKLGSTKSLKLPCIKQILV